MSDSPVSEAPMGEGEERLLDRGARNEAEQALLVHLRRIESLEPWSASRLAAVRDGLHAQLETRRRLPFAKLAFGLIFVSSLAGASLLWRSQRAPTHAPDSAPPAAPVVAAVGPSIRPAEVGTAPTAIPEPLIPPSAVASATRAKPHESDTELADESSFLQRALQLGRKQRTAEALATLDQYGRQFPKGVLAQEAQLTRVRLLVQSGDKAAALKVLDGMTLTAAQASTLLLRGELRAGAGRAREAIADFDGVLRASRSDDVAERALAGRAQAELVSGQPAAAADDARRYLARFPNGHSARALGRIANGG